MRRKTYYIRACLWRRLLRRPRLRCKTGLPRLLQRARWLIRRFPLLLPRVRLLRGRKRSTWRRAIFRRAGLLPRLLPLPGLLRPLLRINRIPIRLTPGRLQAFRGLRLRTSRRGGSRSQAGSSQRASLVCGVPRSVRLGPGADRPTLSMPVLLGLIPMTSVHGGRRSSGCCRA